MAGDTTATFAPMLKEGYSTGLHSRRKKKRSAILADLMKRTNKERAKDRGVVNFVNTGR